MRNEEAQQQEFTRGKKALLSNICFVELSVPSWAITLKKNFPLEYVAE